MENLKDLIKVAEAGYSDMIETDPEEASIFRRLIDDSKKELERLNLAAYTGSEEDAIYKAAMSIVHVIGERVGASADARQSTNDANVEETVTRIKRLILDLK